MSSELNPGLFAWLLLTSFLFSAGIFGVLTRRSAVGVLISIELMLNAGALNLVIFNRFISPKTVDAQVMTIFVVALAAAEILAAIAILVMLYRKIKTTDVSQFNSLRN